MDFQALLDAGEKLGGKRTTSDSVSLNKEIADAQAIQRHQADVEKVRARERAAAAKAKAAVEERQQLRALYNTDDPRRIAAIKATGAFDPDLAQRMRIDPEGTAAAVERAAALAGKGGLQELPDEPAPPDRIFYRKNEKGTLEFTNRGDTRSKGEGWRRYNSDSGLHKDVGAPGGKLGRVGAGDEDMGLGSKTPEEIMFEGRLDEARAIAGKPERDEKKAKVLTETFNKVFEEAPDISTARKTVEEMFMSGAAKKRGLTMRDMKFLDAALAKRGKNTEEFSEPGIDKTYFKPWVKRSDRPGKAADIAEPATVLNPGGNVPESVRMRQGNMLATSEAGAALEETLPRELPTAYKYAKGTATPNPKQTPTPKRPMPQPGAHLRALEGENPLDKYLNPIAREFSALTPDATESPDAALRKRRSQADPYGMF